jgi:hypothetical protein
MAAHRLLHGAEQAAAKQDFEALDAEYFRRRERSVWTDSAALVSIIAAFLYLKHTETI